MSTEKVIIGRLLCELKNAETVALGPGLPQQIVRYLSPTQHWVNLGEELLGEKKRVDMAFVEAGEVSEEGDLVAREGTRIDSVDAQKWVAVGTLSTQNGDLRMVKTCDMPVDLERSVSLIVTDLGVVGVSNIGFELREISPGFATDDVRLRVEASLHVVDNIRRIQLCD